MTGGLLLIAAALFLTCYNLWDEQRASASAEEVLLEMDLNAKRREEPEPAAPGEAEIPDYLLDPGRDMPAVEVDGSRYIGVLEVPSLGLELPVMETWSYPNLRTAPCRYSGSAYQDSLIVAAHNYKTHFGRLKELKPGDEVRFTDTEGNVFRYVVAKLETLGKYDVEAMVSGGWTLTLFTCTYGGQSRVTVRCQRQTFDLLRYGSFLSAFGFCDHVTLHYQSALTFDDSNEPPFSGIENLPCHRCHF